MDLRPSYPVLTERLLLRPLEPSDAAALHDYRSRPEVARYVPFEPMTPEVIADRLAKQWARRVIDAEDQSLTLGVVRQDTGQLVGDVVLFFHSVAHRGGEIGYTLHPDAAGHGFATEAAHAMLHLGFDVLGLRRVIARIDPRNEASARVLIRLGMRQEAYLVQNEWFKGGWADESDFALLAAEWTAAHAERGCAPVR